MPSQYGNLIILPNCVFTSFSNRHRHLKKGRKERRQTREKGEENPRRLNTSWEHLRKRSSYKQKMFRCALLCSPLNHLPASASRVRGLFPCLPIIATVYLSSLYFSSSSLSRLFTSLSFSLLVLLVLSYSKIIPLFLFPLIFLI